MIKRWAQVAPKFSDYSPAKVFQSMETWKVSRQCKKFGRIRDPSGPSSGMVVPDLPRP